MKKILFLVFALYLLRIGLSAEADTFSKDVELNLDILDVRESINLRQPTITEDIQLVPPEPQSIEDVTGDIETFSEEEITDSAEEVTETIEEFAEPEAPIEETLEEEFTDSETPVEEMIEEEIAEEATDIVPEESQITEEELDEYQEEEMADN